MEPHSSTGSDAASSAFEAFTGQRREAAEHRRDDLETWGVCYWRVRAPLGVGSNGVRLLSLAQFSKPLPPGEDRAHAVRGWAAVGSVWLGRLTSSQLWVELLTDGGPLLYMRRGQADSSTDAFLERAPNLASALADPAGVLQDMAMPPGAVAATTRLVFGQEPVTRAIEEDDDTESWTWWKVTEKFVYVRVGPQVGTMDRGTVPNGRIVLARPCNSSDWVTVYAPGHGGLFIMKTRHDDASAAGTPLLEPVTDARDVLESATTIQYPWSLDMSFGGSFEPQGAANQAARITAEEVFHRNSDESLRVVALEDVSNVSQLHRTFKVLVDGWLGQQYYYLKCDRNVSKSGVGPGSPRLPHVLHKARIAAAVRVLSGDGLIPRPLAEGPRFRMEADAGKVLTECKVNTEPWTMKTLGLHFATVHRCDTSFFDEWRQLIRAELPWTQDIPDGSYVWWYACRKGAFEQLPEDKIRAWAALPEAMPMSPAGRRAVLCHGDVSPSNLAVAPNGKLQSIDPEWSCVTYSPLDLSRAVLTGICQTKRDIRELVMHYLEASGFPSSETDIDDYIFDVRCSRLVEHYYDSLTGTPPKVGIATMRSTAALARKGGSPFAMQLRALIIRDGLTQASKAMREGMPLDPGGPRSLLDALPDQRRRRSRSPQQQPVAATAPSLSPRSPVPLAGPPAATEEDVWWWRLEALNGRSNGMVEGSQIYSQPLESSRVVGFLAYGAVVQARAVEAEGWLQLFLEGGLGPGRLLFARRLAGGLPKGLVRQDAPAKKLQASPNVFNECLMSPAACAATQSLLKPGWPGGPAAANAADAPIWWRTMQRLYVRTEKSTEEETIETVMHAGKVVLAKTADQDKWVDVVVPGGPSLHMLTYKAGLKEPELMRPAESITEVLSSADAIAVPWSVDRNMGGAEISDDAVEAVHRLASEAIFGSARAEMLQLDEVPDTTKGHHKPYPPQQRIFSVQQHRNGESYIMQCDKPRPRLPEWRKCRPLPQILCKARHMEIMKLLSQRDLGPSLLAEGEGWHLEALGKLKEGEPLKMEEVGRILAKIAEEPIAWFEKYRPVVREHLEWMSRAGDGSHVWRYTGNKDAFVSAGLRDEWSKEDLQMWAESTEFEPRSPAARTLVTCHGDVCPENFVRTSSGRPKCINLNFACVTFAVEDISRALHTFVKGAKEKQELRRVYQEKFRLVHSYLLARELPAGDREVDDFIVDAQCWRLADVMLQGRSNLQDIRQAVRLGRQGGSDFALRLRRLILFHTLDKAGKYWRRHLGNSSLGAELTPVPRERGRSQGREERQSKHRARTLPAKERERLEMEELWEDNMLAFDEQVGREAERLAAMRGYRSMSAGATSRSRSPVPEPDVPFDRPLRAIRSSGEEVKLDVSWGAGLWILSTMGDAEHPKRLQQAIEIALNMRPMAVTRFNLGSGRTWIVVGGHNSFGIKVRKNENRDSPVLNAKLAIGTIIEERQRKGDRLHYRRLRGDGPDFGWVSIQLSKTVLLMPLFPPGMLGEPEQALALEDSAGEAEVSLWHEPVSA